MRRSNSGTTWLLELIQSLGVQAMQKALVVPHGPPGLAVAMANMNPTSQTTISSRGSNMTFWGFFDGFLMGCDHGLTVPAVT